MSDFHLRPCTIFINREKAMNIVYISKSPIDIWKDELLSEKS